jgi:hypothetical protein
MLRQDSMRARNKPAESDDGQECATAPFRLVECTRLCYSTCVLRLGILEATQMDIILPCTATISASYCESCDKLDDCMIRTRQFWPQQCTHHEVTDVCRCGSQSPLVYVVQSYLRVPLVGDERSTMWPGYWQKKMPPAGAPSIVAANERTTWLPG